VENLIQSNNKNETESKKNTLPVIGIIHFFEKLISSILKNLPEYLKVEKINKLVHNIISSLEQVIEKHSLKNQTAKLEEIKNKLNSS
jgi:hypothetical protein